MCFSSGFSSPLSLSPSLLLFPISSSFPSLFLLSLSSSFLSPPFSLLVLPLSSSLFSPSPSPLLYSSLSPPSFSSPSFFSLFLSLPQGDFAGAAVEWAAVLDLATELRDDSLAGHVLQHLACCAIRLQDFDTANKVIIPRSCPGGYSPPTEVLLCPVDSFSHVV